MRGSGNWLKSLSSHHPSAHYSQKRFSISQQSVGRNNMCWHTLSWVPKKLYKFTSREAPSLLQWKGEIPLLPHTSAFQSAVKSQYNEPLSNKVLGIMNDFLYPSNSTIQSNLYITALYIAVTRQLPKILSCLILSAKAVTLPFPKGDRCTQDWLYRKKNLDIMEPRYWEEILPFPWYFIIPRLHCNWLIPTYSQTRSSVPP